MPNPYNKLFQKYGLDDSFSSNKNKEDDEEERKRKERMQNSGGKPDAYSKLYNKYGMADDGSFSDESKKQEVQKGRDEYNARKLESQAKPINEKEAKGFFESLKEDVAGGVVDYTEMMARAGRALPGGPKAGEQDDNTLSKIIDWAQRNSPSSEDENRSKFSNIIHQGIRGTVTSLSAGLPAAAAGAAVGSIVPGLGTVIGGIAGFAIGGGTTFGLSQFDSSLEDAKPLVESGEITQAEAETHALAMGSFEGGFEFVANILEGLTLGTAKIVTIPAKQALKEGVGQMFKSGMKAVLKRGTKISFFETGSEVLTGGAQTEENYRVGLTDKRFLDGAVSAFGPAFVTSLIFFGLGEGGIKSAQISSKRTLENADADPDKRRAVSNRIYEEIKTFDENIANTWKENSEVLIEEKKPIITNESIEKERSGKLSADAEKLKAELEADPNKIEDEEFLKNLNQKQGELDTYIESSKENIIEISKEDGRGAVSVSVVEVGEGKFAVESSAATDSVGVTNPFDYKNTFSSKEEAIKSATKNLKAWANEQAKTAEGEDLRQIMDVIDNLDEVENAKITKEKAEALPKEIKQNEFKGEDIASEVKTMGSAQGGFSDYSLDQIKKENYKNETINIDELRKLDPDLDEYIKSGEIREANGDATMNPIISSSGEVLDGYNRIAQAIKDGKTEIEVLKGIALNQEKKAEATNKKAETSQEKMANVSKKKDKKSEEKKLDKEWVKKTLESRYEKLNPNIRALISYKIFDKLVDSDGNILSGQAGKSGVDVSLSIPDSEFLAMLPHEEEHFVRDFLDKDGKETLLDYYRGLNRKELIDIYGGEARLVSYEKKYQDYKEYDLTMADETLRHDMDRDRFYENHSINKTIKKIIEIIKAIIQTVKSVLSEEGNIIKNFNDTRRFFTKRSKKKAVALYKELFNPNIKLGEGVFGKAVSKERIKEIEEKGFSANIRFADEPSKSLKSGKLTDKTIETRQEKIAGKEVKINALKENEIARNLPKFSDEEEAQYEQFKKLVSPKELDKISDVEQLKQKIKERAKVDNILYSQEMTDSEMFDKFKERRFMALAEKGVSKIEKEEIKMENKTLRKLKANLKQRMAGFDTGVNTGTVATKKEIKSVQTSIIQMLKDSNLEANDKAKFISFIKNTQTQAQLEKRVEEINERISRLERLSASRKLVAEIKKVLKSTKIKPRFRKPKGRLTPETQAMLDKIREAVGLTRDQAAEKLQANLDKFQSGIMPIEVAIENKLLSMFSGLEVKSPEKLQEILEQITDIKNTGRMLNELKAFNIASELQALRDFVVDRVTGGKGITPGFETTGLQKTRSQKTKSAMKSIGHKMVFSWDGRLDALEFNNKAGTEVLKKKLGVLEQENSYKKLQKEYIENFGEIIAEAYGVKNNTFKIQKKIIELQEEINLGKFKNSRGTEIELIMTKDEMIKRYMEFQDPTLTDSFLEGNLYTGEIIDAIVSKLSVEDKKLATAQFKLYKKQYDIINPVYSKINGVNLPFNEFYSPIAREGYQLDSSKGLGTFMEDANYRAAVTSGSFNTRVKNLLPIKKQGSLDVLNRHISETNYFAAWAEKIRQLDSVFKDQTVRTAIKQEFTPQFLNSIGNQIDDMTTNGNRNARENKAVNFFRKNFTVGSLMIKPTIAAKQMISTVAYLEKLNPIDFTVGVIDFWRSPIKNARILNSESIMIDTRGANMDRDIQAALDGDAFKHYSKYKSFVNLMMMNVQLGDKGAILTGSWAYRRKLLKSGMNLKDVIKEYESFSSETQQSSDISRLSEVERGGSFEKLFTMYKSGPRQLFAKEFSVVRSMFQNGGFGKENIFKVVRVLAIYHILIPFIFQFVANLGGWDDEDKKEYKNAMILGSLSGLFIFGDIVGAITRQAMGLKVWEIGTPLDSIPGDVNNAIQKIDWDYITAEDVKSALGELIGAANTFGIPAEQTAQVYSGVKDIMEEDYKQGVAQILGWSKYRADERFKEKDPAEEIPALIDQGKDSYEIAKLVLKKEGIKESDEKYTKKFREYAREADKQVATQKIGKIAEILDKKRLNTSKIMVLKKERKNMNDKEFSSLMDELYFGKIISKAVYNNIMFDVPIE